MKKNTKSDKVISICAIILIIYTIFAFRDIFLCIIFGFVILFCAGILSYIINYFKK